MTASLPGSIDAAPRDDERSAGYRGRFAPTPSGPLHFGSLIAALASYSDALAAHGEWLLRIEDVDSPRARPGAEAAILRTLERYGFAWSGSVVRQSTRGALYRAALDTLVANGDAYPCACTRAELLHAPLGAGGERIYPGTCRDGVPARMAHRARHAFRLRVDRDGGDASISYRDRLQGVQTQSLPRDVGDFVIRRTDGLYAYQLAVVVDDAAQGITDVVRGADLLASTPRQIYLQRRLGYATPTYLHVPVAINAAGEKLSKQTRAAPLPPAPLPSLVTAWRWLEQPLPEDDWKPPDVGEFWAWAAEAWTPSRLPPVAMLPVWEGVRGP